jgi:hypothetical protein
LLLSELWENRVFAVGIVVTLSELWEPRRNCGNNYFLSELWEKIGNVPSELCEIIRRNYVKKSSETTVRKKSGHSYLPSRQQQQQQQQHP